MRKVPSTQKDEKNSTRQPPTGKKNHTEELLDEALKETFPASDPPAMLEPTPGTNRPTEGKKKK